ncbi:hypothetical protein F5Y11DRAFT_367508 [Daldinia sp. FL1419]|nr:hypothetical protein F5Y11DRAFT_367508 [Daldinia sp. FL1419]
MPGEEMEITTDFGHTGFGEDIDIDLDFAVGQPDEDMELADFDQVQEISNFNSDTRDELMAEGDDASYGMIDADDIENNEAATVSNDIEIDLGDPDENLWQQNAPQEENLGTVEIDFAETTDVSNANPENADGAQGSWLEAQSYSISKPDEVDVSQVDAGAIDTGGNNALPEDETLLGDSVVSQNSEVAVTESNNPEALGVDSNANVEVEGEARSTYDEQQNVSVDASLQEPMENPVDEQQGYENIENNSEVHSVGHSSQGNNVHEHHDGAPHQAGDDDGSEIGYDNDDDTLEHGEQPSAPVASDHGSATEHPAEQEEQQVDQQDPPSLEAVQHQLGGNPHGESANDHESSDEIPSKETGAPDADEAQSQSDAHDTQRGDHEDIAANNEEKTSDLKKDFVEHPLSIATRHEMYISYGNTDYRLFAKSEADDPNQYFLSDMTALELSLGQLLSSLREVISDELSPLDELVMHVDGLGLEFSESSTADILEEFTFGDILSVYDRLVKNDGDDTSPDLYTYLMVRPSCRQRFIALRDSADSGRGLSEIAIYREETPVDGEEAGNFDSHSPYALPPSEEDDTSYDYEEDGPAEDEDHQDNAGESENNESNSLLAHASGEGENTKDPAGEANAADVDETEEAGEAEEVEEVEEAEEVEETGETEANAESNVHASADGTTADGSIDFSDDELDLSSTKHGNSHISFFARSGRAKCTGTQNCICEACFEAEIGNMEAGWRQPVSLAPVSSGSTIQAEQTFVHRQGQNTMNRPAVSPNEQHVFIPQLQPFRDLQIITNIRHQDQQLNDSTYNHINETLDEADVPTTAEHNDINQHPSPTNGIVDAPNSDITSATATLNGDDKDEIDYSDDDGEDVVGGNDAASNNDISTSVTIKALVEDEITWESDDEDAKVEPVTGSKATVQVSPVSGKRTRSDSDLDESVTERNDVKRRRPS